MNEVYCYICNRRLKTEAEIERCPDCGDRSGRAVVLVHVGDPKNPWAPRD